MIVVPPEPDVTPPVDPDDPPSEPVTFRIVRIITEDSTGDERFWDPTHLRMEHPELF